MNLEEYFYPFRQGIIGINADINTPNHDSIPLVYADWTASGRMYQPIEDRIAQEFLPFIANTHTDTNFTGSMMTFAYHKAKHVIKDHVGANDKDVLISSNSGMTGVVNKFQRILGLKIHESFSDKIDVPENDKPIVFITHMEHHSNQTSWLETIADVVVVPPNDEGLVELDNFKSAIKQYQDRKVKIAAITSCSNVTGIITPYMEVAELMHKNKGYCFVDFACSAPYIHINMHENDEQGRYLDAIYFSPHKFLGGPGATGILVFNQELYKNTIPDNPGGGTVDWTDPWGGHKYVDDIEAREDGGTPAFLQSIKSALCMRLKEEMNVEMIQQREHEIIDKIWQELQPIDSIHILADQHKNRLGVISFYIDELHYNLGVKLLNDYFGIQTRGGCSCAGTYGHYLFGVNKESSHEITNQITHGNCSLKPGWIRLSIHPTHTNEEIDYMISSLKELAVKHSEWGKNYHLDLKSGSVQHKDKKSADYIAAEVERCFDESLAVNSLSEI